MRTTDNNLGLPIKDLLPNSNEKGDIPEEKWDIKDLQEIANTTIKDIPNLLIFPPDSRYGDEIQEGTIFSLDGDNSSDADKRMLTTYNIMGFVGRNDTRLTIASRFSKDDENDFFLHYMLQKVLSINIIRLDQSKTKEHNIWDFLPYLFPSYLKRALSQGIYKSYQTLHYNDAKVKGVIDVKRHIKVNMPFSGKIAYSSRKYSEDNDITELIRHTIEEIQSRSFVASILKSDGDTRDAVQQIKAATGAYNKNDRRKVITKNLKPVSHPYYTKYRDLQKICRLILRHDKLSFGKEKDKIYGLLFDGAWLWEEYLGKELLPPDQFIHPQNKRGTGGDHLFSDEKGCNVRKIYPDFISKNKSVTIADAKYKCLDPENKVTREDYFQILAYMLRYTSKVGYLLFPYEHDESVKKLTIKGTPHPASPTTPASDSPGTLTILGLSIPQTSKSFDEFTEKIKESEKAFKNEINSHCPYVTSV
jgi:5-methylcytosine-specific restriction endonuclease McrBC regulatory subunit McrC